MNTRTRIGLIVLVTATLVLAAVVPALAKKPIETDPNCAVASLVVNKAGVYDQYLIFGALDAYWEDGVLYNYCTVIVSWGDETDRPSWRFATFDEACDYFGDSVTCDQNTLTIFPEQWGNPVNIFDPDAEESYETSDFYVEAHRNGKLLFYKEYTP